MHVLCILVPKCQSDCKFVATSEGCPLSNWKFHRYLGLYTPVRQYIYIFICIYPRVRTEYGIVHHPHREHDLDSRYWHLSLIPYSEYFRMVTARYWTLSLSLFLNILSCPVLSYLIYPSIYICLWEKISSRSFAAKALDFQRRCSLVAATFVCHAAAVSSCSYSDLEWASWRLLRQIRCSRRNLRKLLIFVSTSDTTWCHTLNTALSI